MSGMTVGCTYFDKPGEDNTASTLQIALDRARELGIRSVLVASTRGGTGLRAAELFRGFNLVVISHSAGFGRLNHQELTEDNRKAIEAAGARVLTCQHAFGGVDLAVRKKLKAYGLGEIIAETLCIFGQGMKVVCEMALMAADAGLIVVPEPVIAIAGTDRGADTAVVIRPTNAQSFFSMRIMEILCKPRFWSGESRSESA
jgi:hypothetical protein